LTARIGKSIRSGSGPRPGRHGPAGRRSAAPDPGTSEEIDMKRAVIAAVVLVASTGATLAQDVEAGETSFKKCMPCHDIGEDAKNKVGPELNGIDGRKAGTAANFSYSDANKNSGITWNEQTFKEYIKDPRAKVPGTKMIFPGIKNEKEVDNLWAYLKQFKADGGKK
jgi:cytochrome c